MASADHMQELLGGTLPQFQQRLEHLVQSHGAKEDAFVALRIDRQNWLIDLGHLLETSVPPPLAKGGRAPAGIVGIGNFRGEVLTVVDLSMILLGRPLPDPQLGWATPLHPRLGAPLALLWTDLVGLVPKSEFTAVSPAGENDAAATHAPSGRWIAHRWSDQQGQEWWEFDTWAFVQSDSIDQWMGLDQGETR